MTTYQELRAQGEALLRQAEEIKREEANAAIKEIKEKMALYGLAVGDLKSEPQLVEATKRKKRTGAGTPVPAKYKDGSGNVWSGRGIKPKWLQAALASGKKLEEFTV